MLRCVCVCEEANEAIHSTVHIEVYRVSICLVTYLGTYMCNQLTRLRYSSIHTSILKYLTLEL